MNRRSLLAHLATVAPVLLGLGGLGAGALPSAAQSVTNKGPGFGPDGHWALTEDDLVDLPLITVPQLLEARRAPRLLRPVVLDARWPGWERRTIWGATIPDSRRVDWLFDEATRLWDFDRAILSPQVMGPEVDGQGRLVPKRPSQNSTPANPSRWIVVFGDSGADPAAPLLVSLLRALGYHRSVWLRGGLAEWKIKGHHRSVTPLG